MAGALYGFTETLGPSCANERAFRTTEIDRARTFFGLHLAVLAGGPGRANRKRPDLPRRMRPSVSIGQTVEMHAVRAEIILEGPVGDRDRAILTDDRGLGQRWNSLK